MIPLWWNIFPKFCHVKGLDINHPFYSGNVRKSNNICKWTCHSWWFLKVQIWSEKKYSFGFNSRPHTQMKNHVTWNNWGFDHTKTKRTVDQSIEWYAYPTSTLTVKPILRTAVVYLGETPKCMTLVRSVGFQVRCWCWVGAPLSALINCLFWFSCGQTLSCFSWWDSSFAFEVD